MPTAEDLYRVVITLPDEDDATRVGDLLTRGFSHTEPHAMPKSIATDAAARQVVIVFDQLPARRRADPGDEGRAADATGPVIEALAALRAADRDSGVKSHPSVAVDAQPSQRERARWSEDDEDIGVP